MSTRSAPRFSIVIPTRNRAALLPYALESARWQAVDDLEIVVSDNRSSDGTREVVDAVHDPRVRYVRTPKDLSMPDSFEFALSHARGDFVTYLCDDDALCPSTLARADVVLRHDGGDVVGWLGASYSDDTWIEPEYRNTLAMPTFTDRVFRIDSDACLRDLYRLDGYGAPMLVNSLCRRALMELVKARVGRFFLGASPDFSTAAVLLSQIRSYRYIDRVLSIGGATAQSAGTTARVTWSGPAVAFASQFADGALFRHVPSKVWCPSNLIADTLLEARATLGGRLLDYDVDPRRYFLACYGDLVAYERAGSDITDARQALLAALDRQPADIATAVRAALPHVKLAHHPPPVRVDCGAVGVWNIAECARFVESIPLTTKGRIKAHLVRCLGQRVGLSVTRALTRVRRWSAGE
jgi:glycosyl transferase family 2